MDFQEFKNCAERALEKIDNDESRDYDRYNILEEKAELVRMCIERVFHEDQEVKTYDELYEKAYKVYERIVSGIT